MSRQILQHHLQVGSKQVAVMEAESSAVVARGWAGEKGGAGRGAQASSEEMGKFRGRRVQGGDCSLRNCVHLKSVQRVDLNRARHTHQEGTVGGDGRVN